MKDNENLSSTQCPITVLGAGGWIGTSLVEDLRRQGRQVRAVYRNELTAWLSESIPRTLNPITVIYAIGLTADFRERPNATAEAHVCQLSRVLRKPGIEKLLYLSSTRVYARSLSTCETAPLPCLSSDPSDLYNLSKLLGEALVLHDPRPGLKVVRLSNVVGPGQKDANTFVGALLKEACACGTVTIKQPLNTAKNYVKMADVVRLLPLIVESGYHRLYNLGSSNNTTHAQVAAWLKSQGARVVFASQEEAKKGLSFPPLALERLASEFQIPENPFNRTNLYQNH